MQTSVYPLITGPATDCETLVDSFACNLLCSPYQMEWTTRDPNTLQFVVQVAQTTCAALAACGLDCATFTLPPPYSVRIETSSSSSSEVLNLASLPPYPPLVVALGSASGYGLDTGGLLGVYSWDLVAGNRFQLPVQVGGANVSFVGTCEYNGTTVTVVASVTDFGNGTYSGTDAVLAPCTYDFSLLVNGLPSGNNVTNGPAANSPFHLTYLEPTPCLGDTGAVVASFRPPAPLNQCSMYGSNACCNAGDVATLNDHWAYLTATFGVFPPSECTRQLEIMACGMGCSPVNLAFVNRTAGNCPEPEPEPEPAVCQGTSCGTKKVTALGSSALLTLMKIAWLVRNLWHVKGKVTDVAHSEGCAHTLSKRKKANCVRDVWYFWSAHTRTPAGTRATALCGIHSAPVHQLLRRPVERLHGCHSQRLPLHRGTALWSESHQVLPGPVPQNLSGSAGASHFQFHQVMFVVWDKCKECAGVREAQNH
jgi:hypothetical protein